jgi:tetratricopeptide (TPR) repeat protein
MGSCCRHARALLTGRGLCLAALLTLAPAAFADKPQGVLDLAYGEVLFDYYKQDYFPALTRLMVAQTREELDAHREEGRLLGGGLALSYGQHQEAGRVFREVLESAVEPPVRNRAWWYLAKLYYQRGYYEQARDALGRIESPTTEATEAERRLLGALIELAAGDPATAETLLADWRGGKEMRAFADYNRGVAAIRAGDIAQGEAILDALGERTPGDETGWALRDRANLALGMRRLQSGDDRAALDFFQRVRLEGPMSTRGLLGAGWAASRAGEYEQALGPWRELQRRAVVDPAVQEALLAVPYIYGQVGAYGQAAGQYERAIAAYDAELIRLDEAIAAVRSGNLIAALLAPRGASTEEGWFRQLRALPDSPASRYIPELLASHDFQEGYKNLRDLEFLRSNLAHWAGSIKAFDEMLATRREAYTARAPQARAALQGVSLATLGERRDVLRAQLHRIERDQDALALATPAERRAWERLDAIERRLPLLDGAEAQSAREKYRLLRGALVWKLNEDFVARTWEAKKSLREVDGALEEAQVRVDALEAALTESVTRFEGYDERIDTLRARIPSLLERTHASALAHQRHLEALAVRQLEAQKRRIDVYIVQARFSLAQMYDRAAQQAGAVR